MLDINMIESLARSLQNAAYQNGSADEQDYKSDSYYAKASARSDAAYQELIEYVENCLREESNE